MAISDEPVRTCDPGPNAYNVTTLSKDDGRATVTIRSTWDGISTWPNCDGPIVDVALRNTSPHAWLLSLPFGRASKTRAVPSSINRVYTGSQLATIGLVVASDLAELTMINLAVSS